MSTYAKRKENARQMIIDTMNDLNDRAISWGEMSVLQVYLEKLARRYGLLEELRENGII